jgi:hypothetical protein
LSTSYAPPASPPKPPPGTPPSRSERNTSQPFRPDGSPVPYNHEPRHRRHPAPPPRHQARRAASNGCHGRQPAESKALPFPKPRRRRQNCVATGEAQRNPWIANTRKCSPEGGDRICRNPPPARKLPKPRSAKRLTPCLTQPPITVQPRPRPFPPPSRQYEFTNTSQKRY